MKLLRSTSGLVMAVSLVLAGATFVVCAVVYEAAHEALEAQLDHRIEAESEALLALYDQGGMDRTAEAIRRREDGERTSGMGYILLDAAGRRVAGALNATVPQPGWMEFLKTTAADGRRGDSQAITTRLPNGARLVVAADRTPIYEVDGRILKLSIGAFVAMLLVGVGAAWVLGVIIRRRLDQINAAAQAIIDGDHARRMPRDGTDNEFDKLADNLNCMLDRNAELLETLQQVSSDIAHDLRTPLARLQNSVDGALSADLDSEGYRKALEAASDRAREMLEMFAALLRISEVETLQVREGFRAVDLSMVVESCIDAFRPDVEGSGRTLTAAVDPWIEVEGDRHLLSQLLVNLIENAARHTPSGSRIHVGLARGSEGAVLTVADDGPGIPDEARARVFRRFTRLEASRSTPGHGLGLSLARAVALAHRGELSLGNGGPGLVATLRLPAEGNDR